MDVTDRLNLDRAVWALIDAKVFISRAVSCLKHCGMTDESERLNQIYYDVWHILDGLDDKEIEEGVE